MTTPRKSRFSESLMKARSKGEISPPSVISLYGVHRVTVEPSDEMKEMFQKTYATLEEINEALQELANSNKPSSQIIGETLLEPEGKPETTAAIDEPTELSGVNEEALKEFEEEKYGHIVSADDIEWNKIPGDAPFDWREEGKTLILRYSNISHDTNWETIRKLLKFPGGRGGTRTQEIIKVIRSKTSKKIVAFRTFCRCIEEGIIEMPAADGDRELDEMFSTFEQEVNPDEPMLAGLNLTRIKGNCGNGEAC